MWDFADIYKKDQFAFSYLTLHEWNYKKLKGKQLKSFLEAYGYRTVAMYSLGTLGNIFLEELLREDVNVAYLADRNKTSFPAAIFGIPVVAPEEVPLQNPVDAIIVCHVYYYNQIADELVRLGIPEEKILSLNDIVFTI